MEIRKKFPDRQPVMPSLADHKATRPGDGLGRQDASNPKSLAAVPPRTFAWSSADRSVR